MKILIQFNDLYPFHFVTPSDLWEPFDGSEASVEAKAAFHSKG